ncbi:MAG TPA: DUF5615 family PIN-like protein, partial [Thermoleophilia bacterium]|nr:DUF5615 family PIN-like protein [Thermoleophilia bacterium]
MKRKLDQNLGEQGRAALIAAGHDVDTVADERLDGAADPVVLAAAVREGRALITLDVDFANPRRFPPAATHGLAVIRLPNNASDEVFDAAVRMLADGLARADIR